MKVNKLKQILFDSNMQQRDSTTELKSLNHSGGNHNGRKSGSKNKLSLKSLDKKLDLSIKSLDSKIDKLAVEVKEIKMTVAKLAVIVENGFKQVNARIDNLVIKNNLKE